MEFGVFAYVAVLAAAAVEGEVVFIAASALVASGRLHPVGVVLSGALGAALGDQFYFFAIRSGAARWLPRRGADGEQQGLLSWVRRHQTLAVAAVRFAPGLRITLTLLCAAAGVSAWRFCLLNFVTALVWAVSVMGAVAYGGPHLLARLGLGPFVASAVPAVTVLALVAGLSPILRRGLTRNNGIPDFMP